ncbi:MAG: pyridoxal phosphate-dependent aminotransferase [Gemmatimonadetes bacterium]|nr:pyridoxal phosphate-dependent aminotransferase [Gemmatimonadota bacterium]MDA1104450.1 pyridoxal phosphate-dependent aminotransferase [Gemmatimonadota bacterium]
MQFSSNVEKLKPSATIAVSTLAKRLAAEGRDIINLSAGEPDFGTPTFVSEAAIQGIRDGQTRYTAPAGIPELRKAIAARLSERAGRDLDWEGVVVTSGAKQSLFNAIFSLFGSGDEVLIAAPYWTTYPDLVTIARAESVEVFGPEENDFKITPQELEAAATERTRGLIINTPCNPTGAVYDVAELQAIAEWCRDRDIWLISDEIYRSIHHDGDGAAPGVLSLPAASLGRYVLVDGASKSFAMTGWRIGFSFADTKVSKTFTALQSQVTSNSATPSQVAALAAYGDAVAADASIKEMGVAFRRRRDLVTARMRELLPGVPFIEPRGAFYLFFRVDGFFDGDVQDATAWCSRLLTEKGVALVPGGAFGDDRWVRMSFATSDDLLDSALTRIAEMVGAGAST